MRRILTLGLVLGLSGLAQSRQLKLEVHTEALDKDLVCNDGSPGGYYAHFQEGANLWLFFQVIFKLSMDIK